MNQQVHPKIRQNTWSGEAVKAFRGRSTEVEYNQENMARL